MEIRRRKLVLAIAILMLALVPSACAAAVIIDHTCTDLSLIPDAWIEEAKSNLHIAYPDLSQGDWIDEYGVTPWVTATRNLLNNPANYHVNVIMWSWCSINGHNITRYLENMEILVAEYPNVDFVFMTGHAEGQGEEGFIYAANQQIRQHCIDNDRILFDFGDIESYDPDWTYYYDKPMWDDLDYNPGRTNNWGIEWCSANVGSELEQLTTGNGVDGYGGCGSCAHSGSAGSEETINCVLKGRAVWWMLAGFAAEGPSISIAPKSHDFGDKCEGETDNTTFELWNSGTGTLTYSLSETCGWVEVNPTSGSSTGEHDTITVDIDTTGLSEGLLTCDISISSNDGTGTFTLRANIVSKPDLIITEKWLCWPDNCTICYNVTNTGDGTAPAGHNTALYVDGVAVAHDRVPVDLAPGESYTGYFDGYVWTYTPPSDNITVCADNSETVVELDEDNNCLINIWICGDVTGDGRVRTSDGRRIFRHLTFGVPIDNLWAADVTGDGRVRTSDGRRIFRHLTFGDTLNCKCSG
jgi:hypothetical protein